MQPVSGVLSTQKARTPGWDSQHMYTGEALLTRRDTASAEASFPSSSELSPCSIRLATMRRLLCCSEVRGEKMWLAQILARCPVLLQFLQTTSADTLQSFTECTVLPQHLHFPWKIVSACSFFGEALFGRWFLAWLLFCAFWVFLLMAYALSLLCSLHRFDLSHPWASFLMNCHVTPTPWRPAGTVGIGSGL